MASCNIPLHKNARLKGNAQNSLAEHRKSSVPLPTSSCSCPLPVPAAHLWRSTPSSSIQSVPGPHAGTPASRPGCARPAPIPAPPSSRAHQALGTAFVRLTAFKGHRRPSRAGGKGAARPFSQAIDGLVPEGAAWAHVRSMTHLREIGTFVNGPNAHYGPNAHMGHTSMGHTILGHYPQSFYYLREVP